MAGLETAKPRTAKGKFRSGRFGAHLGGTTESRPREKRGGKSGAKATALQRLTRTIPRRITRGAFGVRSLQRRFGTVVFPTACGPNPNGARTACPREPIPAQHGEIWSEAQRADSAVRAPRSGRLVHRPPRRARRFKAASKRSGTSPPAGRRSPEWPEFRPARRPAEWSRP